MWLAFLALLTVSSFSSACRRSSETTTADRAPSASAQLEPVVDSGPSGDASPPTSPPPEPASRVTSSARTAVRQLTGARTKLAWVQDRGDGTDAFLRGTRLALMALDTDDGRGERELVGDQETTPSR